MRPLRASATRARLGGRFGWQAERSQPQTRWLLRGGDELFRSIYTRAEISPPQVIAMCSAIAGEGKTTVSLGLAVTLAQDFPADRVLLVETDLDRPILAADFDVEPTPGLAECILNGAPVEVACRATELDNLRLMPAGTLIGNAGRLLRSPAMPKVVEDLRQTGAVVILDVPAVFVNSDALPLTDLADGLIFVVRGGVTPVDVVDKALGELDAAKLRGIVLNGRSSSVPRWLRHLYGG